MLLCRRFTHTPILLLNSLSLFISQLRLLAAVPGDMGMPCSSAHAMHCSFPHARFAGHGTHMRKTMTLDLYYTVVSA